MGKDVILACDFPDKKTTLSFLKTFGSLRPFVKIGMELFYSEGPDIIREIKSRGHKVFLDLKLHDIPNTVEKAMASLSKLDIDMTNVHAAGTVKMMEAARRGLTRADGSAPILIAVTQLTSTGQEQLTQDIMIDLPMKEVVAGYAKNAKKAGLDGVVCSPLEAEMIHAGCGEKFLTVTPGIRFADSSSDDQSRITTPAKARETGSDYIVVGRPVTQSKDPVEAYGKCIEEFVSSDCQ